MCRVVTVMSMLYELYYILPLFISGLDFRLSRSDVVFSYYIEYKFQINILNFAPLFVNYLVTETKLAERNVR